jgi:ABC-2 type transport system ATP-binding protein
VRIRATDSDAVVAGLYRSGWYPRGIEVTSLGLEQAFLTITEAAESTEATDAALESAR